MDDEHDDLRDNEMMARCPKCKQLLVNCRCADESTSWFFILVLLSCIWLMYIFFRR